jgi:hypothetical protein
MTTKYAILMETTETDHESWYYFLKYNGNETALKHIKEQLDRIDEVVMSGDINIFDIDVVNLVSETCVDEMIMLELNAVTYHRKFEGVLDMIDFGFDMSDDDDQKLSKVFAMIGDGEIDQYITGEFIPPDHVDTDTDSDGSSTDEDYGIMDTSKLPKALMDFKI